MEDCLFCKIIKGEIPSYKVLETEHVLAFLTIGPANRGHTLVITKEHAKSLPELSQEAAAHTIHAVQKVAKAVLKTSGAPGFNLLQNNHEVSGLEVPHVHFHIIPRHENDGHTLGFNLGELDHTKAEELRSTIEGNLE